MAEDEPAPQNWQRAWMLLSVRHILEPLKPAERLQFLAFVEQAGRAKGDLALLQVAREYRQTLAGSAERD